MNAYQQKAQLLAGDPTQKHNLPTVQIAMQQADPMLGALGSYMWWGMVGVLTLMFGWLLLNVVRRYV